ncbi:hypothetical protein FDP41_005052 [Naegleria fowleri]|uniref:Uncharacterized protein n=1 Tax=Naegleria fowleri TaxID=5763 RepID=A0A6A5BQK4_NAEFO|nr:uncharacterized protein FDP41_005052 [Naegleria fowleri]KAF0975725.1 hypothetical protein FDP41_005052 [Naegleria fowleri]
MKQQQQPPYSSQMYHHHHHLSTTGRDRAISSPAPLQTLKTTTIRSTILHSNPTTSFENHRDEFSQDHMMQEDDDDDDFSNQMNDTAQVPASSSSEMVEDDSISMATTTIANPQSSSPSSSRRFSLPSSSDLMNMPFYRQQKIDHFQQWYGLYGDYIDNDNDLIPLSSGIFAQQQVELKDITGMKVLSSHECQQQCEILMRELKDLPVDLNLHV